MHCPGKCDKIIWINRKDEKANCKLLVYLYTVRKLITLSRAGCVLRKHDAASYAEKKRQETLKCIFDLFIFTQTDTQGFIQILPFGGWNNGWGAHPFLIPPCCVKGKHAVWDVFSLLNCVFSLCLCARGAKTSHESAQSVSQQVAWGTSPITSILKSHLFPKRERKDEKKSASIGALLAVSKPRWPPLISCN